MLALKKDLNVRYRECGFESIGKFSGDYKCEMVTPRRLELR